MELKRARDAVGDHADIPRSLARSETRLVDVGVMTIGVDSRSESSRTAATMLLDCAVDVREATLVLREGILRISISGVTPLDTVEMRETILLLLDGMDGKSESDGTGELGAEDGTVVDSGDSAGRDLCGEGKVLLVVKDEGVRLTETDPGNSMCDEGIVLLAVKEDGVRLAEAGAGAGISI